MITNEEKRKIWLKFFEQNNDIMQGKVQLDIEKYRKGNCKIQITNKNGEPLKNFRVELNQSSHDFKFGAHIFMLDEFENEEDNQRFREIFKDYFNLATIPFYWKELEPEKGKLRFDKNSPKIYRRPSPDLCLEYCKANNIDAKLHCLVYENFIPDWLPKNDLMEMEKAYEKRIKEIAERYSGKLVEFEVINETLCEYRWNKDSIIMDKRDVVEWSFDLARKYLPFETLVINENNPLPEIVRHDYRSSYFMQIEKCLLNGANIDKIGLQHHIFTGARAKTELEYERELLEPNMVNPIDHLKMLDIMAEFGLPLELTEVTIPTFGDTEDDEELQAELLKNLYSIWFSHPAVDTIVYWNQIEGYCYEKTDPNDYWNENNCRGGLFHQDLTPKKSALMLKKLIKEIWHTEGVWVTDENGVIEFTGFYGDYELKLGEKNIKIGIHKNENNSYVLEI